MQVVELDPEERYYRYKESVGKGRFKSVFKAFDTQLGIDVAWSKINTAALGLSEEQLAAVARDIQKGLELDHPNIIRCFKCWESADQQCINLITELFTSGNLRQYRNLHKHLDLKAVKRMARQILKGLEYLHGMQPPITHGDLRCDKIYVNGHSGEIKIGDLGLATLLPFRWQEQQQLAAGSSNGTAAAAPPATPPNPLMGSSFSPSSDIFAFGLCMLELLTLKQLDPQHCPNIQALVAEVQDDECRQFVAKCVAPPEERPTAVELLEHPFLVLKKPQQQQGQGGGGGGGGGGLGAGGTGGGGTGGGGGGGGAEQDLGASLNASSRNLRDALDKRRTEEQGGSEQVRGLLMTRVRGRAGAAQAGEGAPGCTRGPLSSGAEAPRACALPFSFHAERAQQQGATPLLRALAVVFCPDLAGRRGAHSRGQAARRGLQL